MASAADDDDSDDEDDHNVVKTIGNEIFFYSDVTTKKVFELIEQVKELETTLLKQAVDLPGYTPEITIYIQSSGGDVYAGFSGMDHLKQSRVNIYTVADGCCASAATFLLLGGTYRYVNPHTQVLIHQISSSGFWGKFEELKDEMAMCEKLMTLVKKIYTENTEIPDRTFRTLMKRDVYLSPEECLEFRIVDEIVCPCSA
jgi:ATP-dependent Clp endopeptidase proteolytic subunit ClpP